MLIGRGVRGTQRPKVMQGPLDGVVDTPTESLLWREVREVEMSGCCCPNEVGTGNAAAQR